MGEDAGCTKSRPFETAPRQENQEEEIMKAAEYFVEKIAAVQTEAARLQIIREIQVDALNSMAQFSFTSEEHRMAMALSSAADALEALGDRPTPVKPNPAPGRAVT
jgi:hypothetical protein